LKRPAAVGYCLHGSRSCRWAAETRNWTPCTHASGTAAWAGETQCP